LYCRHSLGGATAGLTSLYYEKTMNQSFETHLLSSYGLRCVAKKIAPEETNWKGQSPNIHYWVTDYDLVPQLDNPIGEVCRLGYDNNSHDACVDAYGKGMELCILQYQTLFDCLYKVHVVRVMMSYCKFLKKKKDLPSF